jgi:3-oxoacyl-[acyl-carrier-protein] synthase III
MRDLAGSAGIRSVGTCPGEVPVSVAELAARCQTTEQAIARSLGDRRVRVTREPPLRLALAAAHACLENAGASIEEVEAIVWFGDQPSGLRLQHELGAGGAFTLFVDGYCSEMVPALRIARDLVRDGAHGVLIVSEDRFERPYTAQRPSERGYSEITSEAGSAVLVASDAALELSAFGFATRAHDWDYWIKYHEFHEGRLPADKLPDPIGVAREEIVTRRTALERCLRAAELTVERAAHFSLPERVRPPMLSLARQLGIASAKVVAAQYGHMGRSDVVFDLERLLEGPSPVAEDDIVLMTATTGVCRCAALRRRSQKRAATDAPT